MKARCRNPKSPNYRYYGGKGIRVCARWANSFEAFIEDMGVRPAGMTLDRKDSAKDYEPSNCRWATPREQVLNQGTRTDAVIVAGKTLTEWAAQTGEHYNTLKWRYKRYGSLEARR